MGRVQLNDLKQGGNHFLFFGSCAPRGGKKNIQKYLSSPLSFSASYEPHSCCQFSSVAQLCPTLCDPMDCSMPGLPVLHYLPEFAQIHIL